MDEYEENITFSSKKLEKKTKKIKGDEKLKFSKQKPKNLCKYLYRKCFILITIFLIIIIIIIIATIFYNKNKIIIRNDRNQYEIINIKDEIKSYEKRNINNTLLNKGFLKINTKHKSKFTNYDYSSNIKVYKDLYDNDEFISITDKNTILESKQISKEDFCKICEEGVLLDKTKYKRNKKPKISVVIPYYNKGNFTLHMLLRSIQNQSFKDIEIIFVDDCSPDEKIKDILEAMKEDNRIILLRHKERKTTLMTRVDGIRYASGEYIIQIDQDDMYRNNLLFEKLYTKAKELNLDLMQFIHFSNDNPKVLVKQNVPIQKNKVITQPELRVAFLNSFGPNSLGYCVTRMIWNKFARRITYLEAIQDLGDEYLNHEYRLYEDTLMMFELSQVAYSYYYMDIEGYRHCTFNSGKLANKNITQERETLAKDQLLFIKLLLYKIDPKYDRYHIYREIGFGKCDNDVQYLNKNEFDLGLEVVEAIFELERIYKNTSPMLLECAKKILKHYEV